MANTPMREINLRTEAKMYRVETFIIPSNNKTEIFRSTEELDVKSENEDNSENVNEIDDMKIANRSLNKSKIDEMTEECDDPDNERISMGKVLNELQVIAKVLTIENILNIPGSSAPNVLVNQDCDRAKEYLDNINLVPAGEIDKGIPQCSTEETPVDKKETPGVQTGARNYLDSNESETVYAKATIELEEPIYECIFEMDEYHPKDSGKINKNENLTDGAAEMKIISEIDEPIYDVPYNCYSELNKPDFRFELPDTKSKAGRTLLEQSSVEDALFKHPKILNNKYRQKSKSHDHLPLPKLPLRTTSLKSIDEGYELEEFCYHGYKNGCTVTTQSPEEISQEIFKENWLQRIESLRQRDTLLRDKEVALQERERLLFKKEKELRILERLVREKVQKADLYLKRCRNSQNLETQHSVYNVRNLESSASNGSRESNSHDTKVVIQSDEPTFDHIGTQSSGNWGTKLFENDRNINSRTSCSSRESVIIPKKLDCQRNVDSRISYCSAESKMSGDSNGTKSSSNSKESGNSGYSKSCKTSNSSAPTENSNTFRKLCSSEVSEHLKRCRISAVGFKNPQIPIKNTKLSVSSMNSRSTENSNNSEMSIFENKVLRNPPNSKSSLFTQAAHSLDFDFQRNVKSMPSENQISKFSAYSSCRSRVKPKISYEDLNSTLSADVGDSSFAITSKKFDPAVFKKPYVFARSASERRVKSAQYFNFPNFSAIDERPLHTDLEGEKVLRKMNENILVSQNEGTKFQNYGSIDDQLHGNSKKHVKNDENHISDAKRFSYLDLEESNKGFKKISDNTKERPVSWNEEANEWLQKKRQAYNLATKKMVPENFENKENFGNDVKVEKSDKSSKKKEGKSKGKRFTIFR